jgi:glucose-1-phosphate thymidylyltransferase
MKGIILATGAGPDLCPATLVVNKPLLPVYDKPMIYYPLSVLMLARIRDICVIAMPEHIALYQKLLGDGSALGIRLHYLAQDRPLGGAYAFVLAREFVGNEDVALILGDTMFYGSGLRDELDKAVSYASGATVFAAHVGEPSQYETIKFDIDGRPLALSGSSQQFVSNFAVTGLYFYDNTVLDVAGSQLSARGELEIIDVNRHYLALKKLRVVKLYRGFAWLDSSTHDALMHSSEFIRSVQQRQGLLIGCPEEVAYLQGFITTEDLHRLAANYGPSRYAQYLERLTKEVVAERMGYFFDQ